MLSQWQVVNGQGTLVLCCSIVLFDLPTCAQLPPKLTNNSNLIIPLLPTVITIKSGESLRVKVDVLPAQTEIAVFLGDLDITSQLQREGQELVYKSTLLPLPSGDRTLTIYHTISPDRWEPVATFLVKIAPNQSQIATQTESDKTPSSATTPSAESSTPNPKTPITTTIPPSPEPSTPSPKPDSTPVTPSQPSAPSSNQTPTATTSDASLSPLGFDTKLNVNIKSQLAESRSPDAGISTRPTSLDASFTGELSAQAQIGTGKLQGKVNLVGTTFQPEALRFNELQERAALIDLSAYSIDFTSEGIGFRVTAANDNGRWKADAGFARSTFTAGGANDPQLTDGTRANIQSQQLRFNLGYNFTSAQNIERQITRFTQSPTVGMSWEFVPDITFALNYNLNDDSDSIGESSTRSNGLDLLLTWNFKTNTFGRENPGSVFLRYGSQSNLNSSSIGNINTNATINTLSAGMSLNF